MSGKGPRFSEKAREAAAIARRAKAALKQEKKGELELFVVRTPDHGFRWEIRRFGGVTIKASIEKYTSPSSARSTGTQALHALELEPVH